jgi:hypothetical protein
MKLQLCSIGEISLHSEGIISGLKLYLGFLGLAKEIGPSFASLALVWISYYYPGRCLMAHEGIFRMLLCIKFGLEVPV